MESGQLDPAVPAKQPSDFSLAPKTTSPELGMGHRSSPAFPADFSHRLILKAVN